MNLEKYSELAALQQATDSLTGLIAEQRIDVFVPPYANTFPLATVAKRARLKSGKDNVAIHSFDWGWDGAWSRKPGEPPFVSSRNYQLFFATEAEFPRIHAAGISFCAVPVSVFHPKFIFLSLPRRLAATRSADRAVQRIGALIREALAKKSVAWPEDFCNIRWISDIPHQAAEVAEAVQSRLYRATRQHPDEEFPSKADVLFWQSRTLEHALGFECEAANADRVPVKAFIWGGPLASAAQHDVRPLDTAERPLRKRPLGWPRLRDQDRPNAKIELGNLMSFLDPQKIRFLHGLYCCIGYKETRKLIGYYMREKRSRWEPPVWDPAGLKARSVGQGEIATLGSAVAQFFRSLFAAAEELTSHCAKGGAELEQTLFAEFRADYDKYCRTINPIAQIYTAFEYAKCLCEHHDRSSFQEIYDRSSLAVHPSLGSRLIYRGTSFSTA